ILLTLPALLLTSAVAVFFETMPLLRGGIGNVAFIFVWGGLLGGNFGKMTDPHNDPLGTGIVVPELFRACKAAFPSFDPLHASLNMGVNIRDKGEWSLTTYPWDGMRWTAQHVLWRMQWVIASLAVAGAAAIPFDRFDTTGIPLKLSKKRKRRNQSVEEIAPVAGLNAADVRLTPLNPTSSGTRRGAIISGAMVWAEWKLIVRGSRWWYIGPLGLAIAAFSAPVGAVSSIVLPIAWFWPVLKWSKLGTREAVHNTEPVFFSAPHPLSRQLAATWISGVMLSVMTGAVVALRFVIAGDSHALLAWCVGALFIPALALALGVWTRSGKAFEATYTALCYAVIQQAAPLDFMGAVPAASRNNPAIFSLLTLLFLLLAIWGRQRHLRN
ncbi:MAG TPA: hypothetical protein VJS69_00525, partial [Candidatus Krumholzibacteria bacterium]|nr:hypothetical protein [Candidatus Krumholzibacteria bacterium]